MSILGVYLAAAAAADPEECDRMASRFEAHRRGLANYERLRERGFGQARQEALHDLRLGLKSVRRVFAEIGVAANSFRSDVADEGARRVVRFAAAFGAAASTNECAIDVAGTGGPLAVLERRAARWEREAASDARRRLRPALDALREKRYASRFLVFGPPSRTPTLLRDGGFPQDARRAATLVAATGASRGAEPTGRTVFVGGVTGPSVDRVEMTVEIDGASFVGQSGPETVAGRTQSRRFAFLVGAGLAATDTPPACVGVDADLGTAASALIRVEGFEEGRSVSIESFAVPFR